MEDELFRKALTQAYQRDTREMHEQIDELIARNRALEQAVRNYHTAIDAMPEFASAADYKRVLAPLQEMAQELLEQETL